MDGTERHCYLIMYDLCGVGKDYDSLISAIKKNESWGHLTKSTWAVVSHKTATEIRNELRHFMDQKDRLIVVRSGRAAAWSNCLASNSWIHDNIIL